VGFEQAMEELTTLSRKRTV